MSESNSHGQIITFYSYKGGTGRSMVLANVAWILASNGKRVLVIDWDLEAPGLHKYFAPFLIDKNLMSSDGVINFVTDYKLKVLTPPTEEEGKDEKWYISYANILNYAVSLAWKFPADGKLDFVPAGQQDGSYSTLVNSFDWQDFYENLGGADFLNTAKRVMRENYDYILIDSRTGVSDVSGLCTVVMPDILVICLTLNNQSIDGAAAVSALAHQQRQSYPLSIFPVVMRIENAEKEKLELRRGYARSKFEQYTKHLGSQEQERYWGEIQFPYIPYYAYEEILATFGDRPSDTNTLLASTERLTAYLTQQQVDRLVPPSELERETILAQYEYSSDPELADKLFSQALDLWREGLREKSAKCTRGAIEIWRELIKTDLKSFGLEFARAQKFLSSVLEESDAQGAFSAATESIDVYRTLHNLDPMRFEKEAATGLTELSYRLENLGIGEKPIGTLCEAIDILRNLAKSNPSDFEAELARRLYDLANWFIEAEQFSEGLKAIQEAVPIYRRLVREDKEQFEPELADCLITFSECLLEMGDIYGALANNREAVEFYKNLVLKNPKRYEQDLAKNFNALLDILSRVDINEIPDGLSSVQEAVQFFHKLADREPKRYQPDLAKSLNMLPEPLSKEGNIDEALTAQQEAIELFRHLRQINPAQYEPDLALSLINLSRLFLERSDAQRSQSTAEEAVEILNRLSNQSPSRYREDLKEAMKLANREVSE